MLALTSASFMMQLVLQFFDSGHEVLDHRGLVLLKFLVHRCEDFSVFELVPAIAAIAPLTSLSVTEQLCLFWQKKQEPKMCRTSMSSVYGCTQLKKKRNQGLASHPPVFLRDAPVVLLPPLVVNTSGIGLFHTARTCRGLTVW